MLILLQSFSKVWIVFSFKINQNYIAKVLCINRDRPERHCNGQCVLMQRIKADEERDKKQVQEILKSQQEVIYSFDPIMPIEAPVTCGIIKAQTTIFLYQAPFSTMFGKGVFDPPDFTRV